MLLGLRLSLLPLCLAGCASQFLAVPDADWQTVPAPVRASVDKQNDAELASARAELAAASAGAAQLRSQPVTAARAAPAVTVARPDPDSDPWDTLIYEHEQARVAGFTRVENARVEWQRTDRAWRERWLAAAEARVEMVTCKRELVRGQAIDRNLPGADRYEVAPLRGQFSRAQQRWHVLATSAREARVAFERASTTLASSKEAYAQLMRSGPGQQAMARSAADDRSARLQLAGWAVTRGDIKRRRGLRHYLDVVATAPPALRKRALKLRSPAIVLRVEAPTPPGAAAEPSRSGPATATVPAVSAKPWDRVEPAGAAAAIRPAAARPAARSEAGVAATKPWDTIEPAARPPVAGKPAAAPATAPAAPGHQAPPAVVAKPATPPAATTASPSAGAPGVSPPATAARSAVRPTQPAAGAPGNAKPAPRRAAAPGPASAAKPVEPAGPPTAPQAR
jgi:hypothetical protein